MIALAASLFAVALPSAPVTVGTFTGSVPEGGLEQIADPHSGGWLQYPASGGYALRRVGESGASAPVELPVQLRGEDLRLTPLPDGWTLALARYVPPSQSHCCLEWEEPGLEECCGRWVFAQRAPDGRWTKPQELPRSRGTQKAAAEPVERRRHVEVAWYGSYFSEEVLVAAAPLGGTLGPAHRARPLLRGHKAEESEAEANGGRIYETGVYGRGLSGDHTGYLVERRVYSNGKLGPTHVVRDPLLGAGGEFFPAAGGAQTYLYGTGPFRLMVALRPPHASRFVHPREVLPDVTEFHTVRSADGRLLILAESPPTGRERLEAVTVSPHGVPGRPHALGRQPAAIAPLIEQAGAIDDDGRWLVASTTQEGGPIWLHSYSPRCRYRAARMPLPGATASRGLRLSLMAGPHGVFHLAWVAPDGLVQTSTIRVACRTHAPAGGGGPTAASR